MKIQPYVDEMAVEIADLFHQSVHAIDPSIYTTVQKEAWAPTPPDYQRWTERLNQTRPLMAVVDDRVAGFMELGEDGYIDGTYTHADLQGMGVASTLFRHLLAEARNRNIECLSVDASLVAMPFFEHRGFSVIKKNERQRGGVSLVNFTMALSLNVGSQTGDKGSAG